MSLKAWAGLLGEFGRQSEAYASRQQELEDKRMEEERENRRMTALLAKEQALETWRANRPLSEREQSVFDEDLAGKKADRQYKESRAQYYSGGGEQVQALAEQIADEQGISVEEALPLAQARIPAAGRRASSGGGGKSGGGKLEPNKVDIFKEEKDEQTGVTVRTYLNNSVIPMKTDEQIRQESRAAAEARAEEVDSGSGNGVWAGLTTARPSAEQIKKWEDEEYTQRKATYDAQHDAAFKASKARLAEFNAQPGGLIAPQGKTGQQEATGKQPSLTDKIGKPNANATVDFEALFKARDDIESNGKDFRADGKPVKSSAGAMYKNQVRPATAADPGLGVKPAKITKGMTEKEKAAEYNRVGDDYLKALVERYDGNIATAYAAYNGGFGRIDRWLKNGADPADLPKETRDYVEKTMAKYESYASKKSNVLDGQEPQGGQESDLAARVKARAEQYKASAQQQEERPEKKGLLAEAQPDQRSLGTKAGEIAKNMTSLEGISDGQRRRAEAIKEKERISDQQWAEMLEKSGKPIADFIRDFIKAYGGATNSQNKTSERLPTAVTGVRG